MMNREPEDRSPTSSAGRAMTLLALVMLALVTFTACSSDGARPGAAEPEEVLEDHIARARDFDLAADCELRSPERIEAMARADGREPDGYCEFATREPMRLADETVRDGARAIYTDMTVSEVGRSDDVVVYVLDSATGTYRERVEVVRVDDRWFLGSVEVDEDASESAPSEPAP